MSEEIRYDENDIEVLEGLEHVRKRPGMYIGTTSSKGLHHLVYEIVDNSIDEAMAGYCDEINVAINESNIINVVDNGRGIPTGIHPKTGKSTLETVLTTLNAGGKFGGNGYKVSGGLHGVGSSVVNALSEFMEAIVMRDGGEYKITFNKGKTIAPVKRIGNSNNKGTIITFKPDIEIFKSINFNYNTLENRIKELAFLNKNILITLEDKRKGKEQLNKFHYEGGIKEYLLDSNQDKNVLHEVVPYHESTIDEVSVEFTFQYTDDYNDHIYSYVNSINTIEGGTHVTGFKNGLLKAINQYATENNKVSKKFIYEDIKEGLTGIISVKIREPEFEGQTKIKLGNDEVKKVVDSMMCNYLEIFFKENKEVISKIINRAIDNQTFRENLNKSKELMKAKEKLGKEVLPNKLADCSSRDLSLNELKIVEGDSAGGSAKQGRDRKFQAILPIRGKILNVEKQRLDRVLSSETIIDIANAIGTGLGDDFDLSKLRYGKITFLVDADEDGGHISTLILTLMWRYMRPLIENGHVYLDCPPLYKNEIGKNKHYTYSEVEQKEFLEVNKDKKISSIQRYKGIGEMNPSQLWETTLNPETRTLKQVTVDDIMKTDTIFTMLMGDKVEHRKRFLKERSSRVI